MFKKLVQINTRPKPFEYYTASDMWNDEHISKRMLEYHLNGSIDVSSRNIKFIDKSVEWIIHHFNLDKDAELIDFGCGPGLYTTRFARNNMNVTGIDFSQRSIEYAKHAAEKEKLDISYINANYLDFELTEMFDLVTMIMCDYCALSPQQRKLMLEKFKKILKPDGSILLDVYSLNAYDAREEKATYEFDQSAHFWSANDYFSFHNTFKYDKEKVILDKYTIIENTRTRVVYNWLQYFSLDTLKNEFEENGLSIVEVYSDVAGTKFTHDFTEFAIVGKVT